LEVDVLPDKRFLRVNDDLKVTISVELFTLLLGGKVSVSGIDRIIYALLIYTGS
jgi:curved DNA-binding protein